MNRINQCISTRSIARSLIPNLQELDNEVCLEEFLLWPPDLFALTSKILSSTGAYTNVIAPLNNKYWPPAEHPMIDYNGKNLSWIELVQYTGQLWRKNLEQLPKQFISLEEYFKGFQSTFGKEVLQKELPRLFIEEIIPAPMQIYWKNFIQHLSPEIIGNVGDFNCEFLEPCGNSRQVCLEGTNICEYCDKWKSFEALMSLHAIADEACAGWGIRTSRTFRMPYFKESQKTLTQEYAEHLLEKHGSLSTINASRCRVLPKRHTPGIGITLRSLSANLAYHNSSVEVAWRTKFKTSNALIEKFSSKNENIKSTMAISRNDKALSILLFPWPFNISSRDFTYVDNPNINIENNSIGFFSYSPMDKDKGTIEMIRMLGEAIDSAKKETDQIDLVVMPECALDSDELIQFENLLQSKNIPAYIVGKRYKEPNSGFHENLVSFNMANEEKISVINKKTEKKEEKKVLIYGNENSIKQNKHHRWKLDAAQILKYNLGQVLSPNINWWEAINIKKRKVNFINIGEEITLCPLICEDLARQDPIADLIRTVGPSLVVTILMDGPQKRERWSAKYASVLSEDPGSTVITLTSFGMVKRCLQTHGNPSFSVALISDGKGKSMEIDMDLDSKGILVNLCLSPESENLADGRIEYGYTNHLVVGGIHKLK